MKAFVKEVYKSNIQDICNALEKNQNILIRSSDEFILETVLSEISKFFTKTDWIVKDVISKIELNERHIILIDMPCSTSKTNVSFLYYYLDQCVLGKCKVVLYTTSLFPTDSMEKRIRSRFSDNIFELRLLDKKQYYMLYKYLFLDDKDKRKFLNKLKSNMEDNKLASNKEDDVEISLYFQYKKNPSVNLLYNTYLRNKYKIKEYTLHTLFNILDLSHISLLILAIQKVLTFENVVRKYRKFISRCRELKNMESHEIMASYYDLVEFNLINEKGILQIDISDIQEYILSEAPLYIRNLYTSIKI